MADAQDSIVQKIKEQGDLVRKLKSAKESSEKVSSLIRPTLNIKIDNDIGITEIKLHHDIITYIF